MASLLVGKQWYQRRVLFFFFFFFFFFLYNLHLLYLKLSASVKTTDLLSLLWEKTCQVVHLPKYEPKRLSEYLRITVAFTPVVKVVVKVGVVVSVMVGALVGVSNWRMNKNQRGTPTHNSPDQFHKNQKVIQDT
eukprot:TRINITY_DN873_c0_g1_i19.p1 TRINITY_DN873_c0_g1~~TRINITY_DN873_c0_g1_i19.p1  ORF type:complete len:134 (-),score=27.69 TRINITY_DN873_c0_g1_i19:938-1339(-)